ncbi:MAG TPA: lysozyme inhibitor LprI family protein, partial [Limnobacter sp.]|uniref:lysozyme inhibitor LprI family protein n=1 Tax=Limnobacter sp. TaxID=2003368 RepID=UPI002E36E89F
QAYASDASLQELSIRSGLSRDQLQEFVSACDSNQLSMYFCAWNSEIASEQELNQVVTDKLRNRPKCQSAVTALSKQWLSAESKRCEKASKQEWGDGSMQPTAHATCLDSAVREIVAALKNQNNCKQIQQNFSKKKFR